jgi:hypothetical protein
VLHPDLVGLSRLGKVPLKRLTGAGLIRLEDGLVGLQIGNHVHLIAILEEDPVVGVQALELVQIRRIVPQMPEEALEHIGHEVPRRSHVEREAIPFEPACTPTDLLVLLQERDACARLRQVACGRESTEATADDHDRRVIDRREIRDVVHTSRRCEGCISAVSPYGHSSALASHDEA